MFSEEFAVIIQLSPFPPLPVPAPFIPTKICLGKKKKKLNPQNRWLVRTGEEGVGKAAEEMCGTICENDF